MDDAGAVPPASTQTGTSPSGWWQPPTVGRLQELFGTYEILQFLGRGGMGAVYQARQKSLRRLVAIKILPPGTAGSADLRFAERFQQEACILAQFNHPSIVSIFDYGETAEGQCYFVMEFVNGTDVGRMLRDSGKLPPDLALNIAIHVCEALHHAHSHGVIHRDIKPANILINQSGQVKVADFGLAKSGAQSLTTSLTRSDATVGTADFLAPEALIPGLALDHRADLYAVGVMLYQMLTGSLPRGMFKLPSEKIPGLDTRVDSIICRALEPERDERYQSALEMRQHLGEIQAAPAPETGRHVTLLAPPAAASGASASPARRASVTAEKPAPPPGPAASGTPPAKSRHWWIAAGLAATAAFAAAAFLLPHQHHDAGPLRHAAPAASAINLLATVDVNRDAIAGEWSLAKDGLTVKSGLYTDTLQHGYPRLQLAPPPSSEYDFEIEFTPIYGSGNVFQVVHAFGRSFFWVLDVGTAAGQRAAFETIRSDIRPGFREGYAIRPVMLTNGRRHRSRVEVRKSGLRGFLDDELLVAWGSGPASFQQLTIPPLVAMRDPGQLGIASMSREVVFHKAEVRPAAGSTAEKTPHTPVAAQPPPAAATFESPPLITTWRDVTEDVREKARNLPDFRVTPEAIHRLGNPSTRINLPPAGSHSLAARTRFTGQVQVDLNLREQAGFAFVLCQRVQTLFERYLPEKPATDKLNLPVLHPPGYDSYRQHELLVTLQAGRIRAWVDGRFVGAAHDDILLTGGAALNFLFDTVVHSVEIAPLPEQPPPDAFNEVWLREMTDHPAEVRLQRVTSLLRYLNPGFNGKIEVTKYQGGEAGISITGAHLQDLRPLRAFTHLSSLRLDGTATPAGVPLGKSPDLSPLKDLPLKELSVNATSHLELAPLAGSPLQELVLTNCPEAAGWETLPNLKLTSLRITAFPPQDPSLFARIGTLKELQLLYRPQKQEPALDLAHFSHLPLRWLGLDHARLLHPEHLKPMPLEILEMVNVTMPAGHLFGGQDEDLDLIRDLPLQSLQFSEPVFAALPQHPRGMGVLRSINTLQSINNKKSAEVLKEPLTLQAGEEAWIQEVSGMPPELQIQQVSARMQELNPGFDGKLVAGQENGVVVSVEITSAAIRNLAPLRAFARLGSLTLKGTSQTTAKAVGPVPDLSPLTVLPLTKLKVNNLSDMDLAPLAACPLRELQLTCCPKVQRWETLRKMRLSSLKLMPHAFDDLTLLSEMTSLEVLDMMYEDQEPTQLPVFDLSLLTHLPLKRLSITYAVLASAERFKSMALEILTVPYLRMPAGHVFGTKPDDLALLENLPLESINLDDSVLPSLASQPEKAVRLRAIKTLKLINTRPVADVLAGISKDEAWIRDVSVMSTKEQIHNVSQRMQDLNPGFDGNLRAVQENGAVTGVELIGSTLKNLAPLRGFPRLAQVSIDGTHLTSGMPLGVLTDLSPLVFLPLARLKITHTTGLDLTPLAETPLQELHLIYCPKATGWQALRKLKLKSLRLMTFPIKDLTHLSEMTSLETLELSYSPPAQNQMPPLCDLSLLSHLRLKCLRLDYARLVSPDLLKSHPLEDVTLVRVTMPEGHLFGDSSDDLALLASLPLKTLHLREAACASLPAHADRVATMLSIKTLQSINNKPLQSVLHQPSVAKP